MLGVWCAVRAGGQVVVVRMSDANLLCGDCYDLLLTLPSSCIDLTVTSPPYDNLREYNGNIQQWGFEKFKLIAKELYRVTKDGGVVVWIVADATIKGSETGSSFRQALWFMDCGFNLHDTMIWAKPSFTAVGTLKMRYASTFEYMFVFSKGTPKTFNPIKDRKNIHAGKKKHGTIRQSNGSTIPVSSKGKLYEEYGQRFNVWHMSPEKSNKKRFHPAQFPEALAHDHIISWSNPGDLVLDPFAGSGTTGICCINTNRRFLGFEICEEYYAIANARLCDAQEGRES